MSARRRRPRRAASARRRKESANASSLLAAAKAGDAHLLVMHLYGDASERGAAHGQLLSAEIEQFFTSDLDGFFKSQVDQLPLDKLPSWLANAIRKLLKSSAPSSCTWQPMLAG